MKQCYEYISSNNIRPFVKWVGGKRQILSELKKYIPKNIDVYFEPFLGGGALFFNMLYNTIHTKFNISDLNPELVLSYITIRDNVNELIESLENHSYNYFMNPMLYYYSIRKSSPKKQIDKVSRFIFLNKTCFNGLYRVNKNGRFNVPLGKYCNPNIVNKENLLNISSVLQNKITSIKCQDFEIIYNFAEKNNFIYFDPPYYPIHNNFTSYTNKNFKHTDLKRLAILSEKLNDKGCKVMISNSNSPIVADLFSSSYWNIVTIKTNRTINSNIKDRRGCCELIITNY